MEEQAKKDALNEEKTNDSSGKRNELFSRSVKAGRRTYFFDVKATRRGEYYLTLTESKKRFGRDGAFHFDKHKIFLYQEDFDKFLKGLNDVVEYIKVHQPEFVDEEEAFDNVMASEEAENNE